MFHNISVFVSTFLALGILGIDLSNAADVAAGKMVAERNCQTCHGMDGVAIHPMGANLTGQQTLYLIAQLEAYRDGKRQHEQMSIIAQMLSDDDIENVVEWYSNIRITLEMPE